MIYLELSDISYVNAYQVAAVMGWTSDSQFWLSLGFLVRKQ